MSGFVDDGECLLSDDDMDLLRSTAFSAKQTLMEVALLLSTLCHIFKD